MPVHQCFKPENIQGHVCVGGSSELVDVSMAVPGSIFLTDLYYKWEKSHEQNRNGIQQTLPSNIPKQQNTPKLATHWKCSTSPL